MLREDLIRLLDKHGKLVTKKNPDGSWYITFKQHGTKETMFLTGKHSLEQALVRLISSLESNKIYT